MLEDIDRNSRTALSVQVSEKLIAEIRGGDFESGKRLPGVRMLAQRFGTSKSTIIDAMDLLEKRNCIERIPSRGTFVTDYVAHELNLARLIFPFPEASISPEILGGMENWAAVSEVYRGLVEEARTLKAEITFQHFQDSESEIQLARDLRCAKEFDGAIFIGNQLTQLRAGLGNSGKACVNIMPGMETIRYTNCLLVNSDLTAAIEEMARHVAERGYTRLRILSLHHPGLTAQETATKQHKFRTVINSMREHKLAVPEQPVIELEDASVETLAKALSPASRCDGQEAWFCSHTDLVMPFYKFCLANDLKIGKDIGIFGYASGAMFTNLIPEFTYSKIDHFRMGRVACRMAISAIRNGLVSPSLQTVPNRLIIGDSTEGNGRLI